MRDLLTLPESAPNAPRWKRLLTVEETAGATAKSLRQLGQASEVLAIFPRASLIQVSEHAIAD